MSTCQAIRAVATFALGVAVGVLLLPLGIWRPFSGR